MRCTGTYVLSVNDYNTMICTQYISTHIKHIMFVLI